MMPDSFQIPNRPCPRHSGQSSAVSGVVRRTEETIPTTARVRGCRMDETTNLLGLSNRRWLPFVREPVNGLTTIANS
jgi:hypothetical protein